LNGLGIPIGWCHGETGSDESIPQLWWDRFTSFAMTGFFRGFAEDTPLKGFAIISFLWGLALLKVLPEYDENVFLETGIEKCPRAFMDLIA